MRKLLLVLLAIGFSILSSFTYSGNSANSAEISVGSDDDHRSHLLEIGTKANTRRPIELPAMVKVISYNIRWRSGEDLQKLVKFLKEDREIGGAAILGLQEVDRNKKRSGNKNTGVILAQSLDMNYAWAAPPAPKTEHEEETGVAIMSLYPLSDVRRLVLPHKGPGGRRRVALGATIKLGRVPVRFYSVHSETRISVKRKLEQMKAVLHDLSRYPKVMPAIVLGDLNTWEPAAVTKTFKLFAAEGFRTPFDKDSTFFRRILFIPISLKLDWIWLRNLEATSNGINRTVQLSDHWPLWVVLKRPEGPIDPKNSE